MDDTMAILLPALAMGLGWGIRGQFGHESGAMVPGALVALALCIVAGDLPPEHLLRIGAMGALGCAVGGVMTYGQTIGLVQNRPHSPTRRWGYAGLAVKGAVWIGLTGAFIGMAAGGVHYGAAEIAIVVTILAGFAAIGLRLFNRPHDPSRGTPLIYFSARLDERPRPEFWGGLWMALAALLAFLQFVRGDQLAVGLACFGIVAGGIGFPVGEWLQAWGNHRVPFGHGAQRWMDWWKVMEVIFGLIGGAGLGLGWLLLRPTGMAMEPIERSISLTWEAALLTAWLVWLIVAETGWRPANIAWEASFVALIIPMALVFAGGYTPVFLLLPVLILLGGDDSVRQWAHREGLVSPLWAWLILAGLALASRPVGAWLVAGGASAAAWLSVVMWVQVGLTVIWALGSKRVFPEGWRWPRVTALGAGFTVEAIFIVMAVLATALAWAA